MTTNITMNLSSKSIRAVRAVLLSVSIIIFASLFVFASTSIEVRNQNLRLLDRDLERIANNVTHWGVSDGREILKVSSSKAIFNKNPYEAENIVATAKLQNGHTLKLTSDHGIIEEDSSLMTFHDNVVIERSDGIKAVTDSLYINTENSSGKSPRTIYIQGPQWNLTAEAMETIDSQNNGGAHAFFTGGVRFTYFPDKESRPLSFVSN